MLRGKLAEGLVPGGVPPGGRSREAFLASCTACGLCLPACPTGVLRLEDNAEGPGRVFRPVMDLEAAACQAGCVACSQVCPSGAILPVAPAAKNHIRIARLVWLRQDCVVMRDAEACCHCAAVCPTGALTKSRRSVPLVDSPQDCVGCRRCERRCPVHAIRIVSAGKRKFRVELDRAKCVACGKCVDVCPKDVFAGKEREVPRLDANACVGCGLCGQVCPTRTFTLFPLGVHERAGKTSGR